MSRQHPAKDTADSVQQRVSGVVQGLRDRTADVVRADGGSVFRELGDLGDRVDDVERSVTDRIAEGEKRLGHRIDAIDAGEKRTTLPRRVFWLLVGGGIGAAAAYLADPDRGAHRRAVLSQQAAARAREAAEQAQGNVGHAVKRATGEVLDQAKELIDTPETDAGVLEARIRSEVFGGRTDVDKVVLRIDGPGTVTLKGTVPHAGSEAELVAAVADVTGVTEVSSELELQNT